MPALLDPSVHRDADAYVGHLIAVLDSEETEADEFWADDRSSRGDGVEESKFGSA